VEYVAGSLGFSAIKIKFVMNTRTKISTVGFDGAD